MPLSSRKVIDILLKECGVLEQRCVGYREEIRDVIADIVQYEREHRVKGTNIQRKINDKCNAAGQFLAKSRT